MKEVLANGRLTEKNKSADFKDKFELLKSIAENHSTGVDAIAMAFVLHQAWVSVALSGAATTEHLLSNLDSQHIKLDAADLHYLNQFNESPESYWKTRAGLEWN